MRKHRALVRAQRIEMKRQHSASVLVRWWSAKLETKLRHYAATVIAVNRKRYFGRESRAGFDFDSTRD